MKFSIDSEAKWAPFIFFGDFALRSFIVLNAVSIQSIFSKSSTVNLSCSSSFEAKSSNTSDSLKSAL